MLNNNQAYLFPTQVLKINHIYEDINDAVSLNKYDELNLSQTYVHNQNNAARADSNRNAYDENYIRPNTFQWNKPKNQHKEHSFNFNLKNVFKKIKNSRCKLIIFIGIIHLILIGLITALVLVILATTSN